MDISYLNLGGTYYDLCSVQDGYSRSIVHHAIRESMTEQDVVTTVQRGWEKFPVAKPRIISGNGTQFIFAKHDRKLEAACERRRAACQAAREVG